MNRNSKFISIAAGVALAMAPALQAQSLTSEVYDTPSTAAEIGPYNLISVLKAVDLGGSGAVVNGITFEADTFVAGLDAAGNGYTTIGNISTEGAPTTAGVGFSPTTLNNGAGNSFVGNQIALLTNTDYVFEWYLSDSHGSRELQVSIDLGEGLLTNTSAEIQQDTEILHRYSVAFNSGTATTFDWSTSDNFHAKSSAFGLYQVPEPSAYAMLVGSLALGVVALRRRRA
ncbi:MAG: PEP-CTERM sorting domain-containing protein [Opitutaceae bacterium]